MQKRTSELKPGDIMQSGEIVQGASSGMYMGRKRMLVRLVNPKSGKERVADWSPSGTVFLRKEQNYEAQVTTKAGAAAHGAPD